MNVSCPGGKSIAKNKGRGTKLRENLCFKWPRKIRFFKYFQSNCLHILLIVVGTKREKKKIVKGWVRISIVRFG